MWLWFLLLYSRWHCFWFDAPCLLPLGLFCIHVHNCWPAVIELCLYPSVRVLQFCFCVRCLPHGAAGDQIRHVLPIRSLLVLPRPLNPDDVPFLVVFVVPGQHSRHSCSVPLPHFKQVFVPV